MGRYSIISQDILTKKSYLSIKAEISKGFRIPQYNKINNREHTAFLFQPYIPMQLGCL